MNIRKVTMTIAAATAMSLAVVSCKPKDGDVKAKVETAIAAPGVMVDVKDGVATLSGTAATDEDRLAWENKAKEVKGVKSVVNNISVQSAAPVIVEGDATLTKAAQDAIKDVPGVTATVANGVVTLTGEAKKEDISRIMQAIMASSPLKVNNNIVVKP